MGTVGTKVCLWASSGKYFLQTIFHTDMVVLSGRNDWEITQNVYLAQAS